MRTAVAPRRTLRFAPARRIRRPESRRIPEVLSCDATCYWRRTRACRRELTAALPLRWYAAVVDHQDEEILLDDEPRFAGGAEISLAYAHLSLVFDKVLRAYSLTCDDEEGEAVRLILEPSELEQIAREFLAAREWSRHAGVALAPLSLCDVPIEQTRSAA